eukprot:jgi/Tetstr1/440822/TSEL_029129.t1
MAEEGGGEGQGRPRVVFNLRERRPGTAYSSPGTPVLALSGVSGPDGATPPLGVPPRGAARVIGLRLPGSPAVDPHSHGRLPPGPAPFPGVEPLRLSAPAPLAADGSPWYGRLGAAAGAAVAPSPPASPGGESTASATAGLIETKLHEARARMDEVARSRQQHLEDMQRFLLTEHPAAPSGSPPAASQGRHPLLSDTHSYADGSWHYATPRASPERQHPWQGAASPQRVQWPPHSPPAPHLQEAVASWQQPPRQPQYGHQDVQQQQYQQYQQQPYEQQQPPHQQRAQQRHHYKQHSGQQHQNEHPQQQQVYQQSYHQQQHYQHQQPPGAHSQHAPPHPQWPPTRPPGPPGLLSPPDPLSPFSPPHSGGMPAQLLSPPDQPPPPGGPEWAGMQADRMEPGAPEITAELSTSSISFGSPEQPSSPTLRPTSAGSQYHHHHPHRQQHEEGDAEEMEVEAGVGDSPTVLPMLAELAGRLRESTARLEASDGGDGCEVASETKSQAQPSPAADNVESPISSEGRMIIAADHEMALDASFESVYTKLNTIQMPGAPSGTTAVDGASGARSTTPPAPAAPVLREGTAPSQFSGTAVRAAAAVPMSQARGTVQGPALDAAVEELALPDSPRVFPELRVSHPLLTSAPWRPPPRLTQPLPPAMRASSESALSELSMAAGGQPSSNSDTQQRMGGGDSGAPVQPEHSEEEEERMGEAAHAGKDCGEVLTVGQAFALLGIELEGTVAPGSPGPKAEPDLRGDLSISNALRLGAIRVILKAKAAQAFRAQHRTLMRLYEVENELLDMGAPDASSRQPPLVDEPPRQQWLAGSVPQRASKNVRAHSSPQRARKLAGGSSRDDAAAAARFRRTLLQGLARKLRMKLVVLALAHRRAAALDASRLVEHAGECATAGRLRAVLAALSGRVAVSRAAAAAAEAHAARAAATRADLGAAAGFRAWAAAAREARWRREQLRRGLLRYRRALLTAGLAHWAASVRSGRLALLRNATAGAWWSLWAKRHALSAWMCYTMTMRSVKRGLARQKRGGDTPSAAPRPVHLPRRPTAAAGLEYLRRHFAPVRRKLASMHAGLRRLAPHLRDVAPVYGRTPAAAEGRRPHARHGVFHLGVDWRDVEAAAALLRQLPAAEARLAASEADLASARAALDAAAPGAAAARADAEGEAARAAMKESELRRVCSALRAEVEELTAAAEECRRQFLSQQAEEEGRAADCQRAAAAVAAEEELTAVSGRGAAGAGERAAAAEAVLTAAREDEDSAAQRVAELELDLQEAEDVEAVLQSQVKALTARAARAAEAPSPGSPHRTPPSRAELADLRRCCGDARAAVDARRGELAAAQKRLAEALAEAAGRAVAAERPLGDVADAAMRTVAERSPGGAVAAGDHHRLQARTEEAWRRHSDALNIKAGAAGASRLNVLRRGLCHCVPQEQTEALSRVQEHLEELRAEAPSRERAAREAGNTAADAVTAAEGAAFVAAGAVKDLRRALRRYSDEVIDAAEAAVEVEQQQGSADTSWASSAEERPRLADSESMATESEASPRRRGAALADVQRLLAAPPSEVSSFGLGSPSTRPVATPPPQALNDSSEVAEASFAVERHTSSGEGSSQASAPSVPATVAAASPQWQPAGSHASMHRPVYPYLSTEAPLSDAATQHAASSNLPPTSALSASTYQASEPLPTQASPSYGYLQSTPSYTWTGPPYPPPPPGSSYQATEALIQLPSNQPPAVSANASYHPTEALTAASEQPCGSVGSFTPYLIPRPSPDTPQSSHQPMYASPTYQPTESAESAFYQTQQQSYEWTQPLPATSVQPGLATPESAHQPTERVSSSSQATGAAEASSSSPSWMGPGEAGATYSQYPNISQSAPSPTYKPTGLAPPSHPQPGSPSPLRSTASVAGPSAPPHLQLDSRTYDERSWSPPPAPRQYFLPPPPPRPDTLVPYEPGSGPGALLHNSVQYSDPPTELWDAGARDVTAPSTSASLEPYHTMVASGSRQEPASGSPSAPHQRYDDDSWAHDRSAAISEIAGAESGHDTTAEAGVSMLGALTPGDQHEEKGAQRVRDGNNSTDAEASTSSKTRLASRPGQLSGSASASQRDDSLHLVSLASGRGAGGGRFLLRSASSSLAAEVEGDTSAVSRQEPAPLLTIEATEMETRQSPPDPAEPGCAVTSKRERDADEAASAADRARRLRRGLQGWATSAAALQSRREATSIAAASHRERRLRSGIRGWAAAAERRAVLDANLLAVRRHKTYRVLYAWRRLALEAAAERRALRKAAVVAGIFTLRTAWRRWRALRARRALLRRVLQRMEAAWEARLGLTAHGAQFLAATRALVAWRAGVEAIRAERADAAAALASVAHWRTGRLAEAWRAWGAAVEERREVAASEAQFAALVACWRLIAGSKAEDRGRVMARKMLRQSGFQLEADVRRRRLLANAWGALRDAAALPRHLADLAQRRALLRGGFRRWAVAAADLVAAQAAHRRRWEPLRARRRLSTAFRDWAAETEQSTRAAMLQVAAGEWRAQLLMGEALGGWWAMAERAHVKRALVQAARAHFARELRRRVLLAWADRAASLGGAIGAQSEIMAAVPKGLSATTRTRLRRQKPGPVITPSPTSSASDSADIGGGQPIHILDARESPPMQLADELRQYHLRRIAFRAWALAAQKWRRRVRPRLGMNRPVRLVVAPADRSENSLRCLVDRMRGITLMNRGGGQPAVASCHCNDGAPRHAGRPSVHNRLASLRYRAGQAILPQWYWIGPYDETRGPLDSRPDLGIDPSVAECLNELRATKLVPLRPRPHGSAAARTR